MALRGNLRDFSLPDVFQLVTFSKKTGVLRIRREGGAEGSVWFRDGDVFFASSNWRKELLGERLVRAQRITPQALTRALKIRGDEGERGRRLGQILIEEGYITEKVLESFVQDQIQDTIFDLMRWDEGEFDFEAMPEVVDEDIGLVVSIENVVMEGSRRLEEWTRIKKKIPSMDVVFKMATAPGEGTFEISLKPMEWQLLLLIDSTRSVSELASETGRTDFEVARVIYGLFSAGLLEFASDDEIAKNRAEREAREARLADIAAERRKIEEAEKAAALAREAALQQDAEKRQVAARPEAVAAEEPAEGAPPVVTAPAEVPSFLGGEAAAPTADDQAALEEFMGAVLGQPVVEAEVRPAPAAKPERHVPVEEPAFIGAAPAGPSAEGAADEIAIEDLLGMRPQQVEPVAQEEPAPAAVEPAPPVVEPGAPAAEAPVAAAEPAAAELVSGTPEVSHEVESAGLPAAVEPEPVAEPVAEPVPEEEIDFERDLLALGLGELPQDLLAPVEPTAAVVQEDTAAEPEVEWVEEPTVQELLSEFGEEPGEPLATEEVVIHIEEPAEEEMDFSALIESLDVDADDFTVLSTGEPEVAPVDLGFDEDLLRDDAPVPSGNVISTDAFLSDITMDDLGFSGGMTDELSALTGAERRPTRPQASVNPLPDENASVLKRDIRVDKDTLMKIIDGIKNL